LEGSEMRRSAILLVLLLLGPLLLLQPVNAEGSGPYWAKTYGGSGDDVINDINVLPNGDIIAVGWTNSTGAGGRDAFVMKLSPNGTVIWAKTYGGSKDDVANAVAIASNGDIIVAGWTKSFSLGKSDVWVLRLDENGNIKWQKTYGGNDDDRANTIAITSTGNIIVTGYTKSFGLGGSNIWVLKLDPNGNIIWQRTYGSKWIHSDYDSANAVAIASNGDIIVVGETAAFGAGQTDVWVLRLDENGNIKWQKTYGVKRAFDEAQSVAIASNGDIIVVGYTNNLWDNQESVWVLRLDENGNIKWQNGYSVYSASLAYAVSLLPNGDSIIVGYAESYGFGGEFDVWVSKIDTNGNIIWQRAYGSFERNIGGIAKTVVLSRSGSIIVGGETFNFSADSKKDCWILHLPPNGYLQNCSLCSNTHVGGGAISDVLSLASNAITNTSSAQVGYSNAVVKLWNPTVSIQCPMGTLQVFSSPSGAMVYIDGNYIGETPLTNYTLSPGNHEITIKKYGYTEYMKTVTITIGKKTTLSASLTPIIPQKSNTNTTPTTFTSKAYPPQTSSGSNFNPLYLAGALIGLLLFGGVAVKVKGGKPKPSPSPEASPTPEKTGIKTQPKPVPGFPPELLDKYEPLEFLGEGGFAKVFKVRRKSDGKIMALKVSRLDEKAKKFFLKEVKAWRLLDHPNIVKLYNAYAEPLPHLEIEFVDGIKLDGDVIRDLGKYPKPTDEEKALHFIGGIAEGLKHAHSKQVFHRDLKPQNVLMTSDLTPKITDWGLAKVGAVSTTATTTKGLTLLYAAPEQLDDETYGHTDQRTDIYQLGLIFYELLTGKLPYQGTSPAVVMAKVINPAVKPKPPSHFNKALAKYDGIFEKLLAKGKEQRYQSVEEFLRDLEIMRKLDEERRVLEKEIEKTKTTMKLTTNSKELKKLMRQLVEQLNRNALLHAQLNDKAGLINALEDLKAFSKEHRGELENAIAQLEVMMRESVPISKSTLNELKILLHKVQREVD